MKRAWMLATRLAGADGVSLGTAKLSRVLAGLGFGAVDCAGEVEAEGDLGVSEMRFREATAGRLGVRP